MLTADASASHRRENDKLVLVLDDAAIFQLFAGLEDARALLLAVSGGPDSIALLLMAARWARDLGPDAPTLYVATVDHGLRPAARQEAEFVAAIAAAHGLPHAILPWTGPKPTTGLQARARAARYALLAEHALTIGATHILTGHHADDQAETVLLRLGRGSGISGLAGMRRLSRLTPELRLVRPLLDLPKATLAAVCHAAARAFVDDPSNHDPAFARARLRAQGPALDALGLDTPGLARLAHRMARADAALEAEVDRVECTLRADRTPGRLHLDLKPAKDVAAEIALRLLRRALTPVATGAIRLERLEALAEAVWTALDAGERHVGTLAGTRVALERDGMLKISAEAPRRRGATDRQGLGSSP